MDLDSIDLRVALVAPCVLENFVERLLSFSGRVDADLDATSVGFVKNVGGDNLHHHRKADVAGELCSGGRGGRKAFLRKRDPVGIANNFASGAVRAVRPEAWTASIIFGRWFFDGSHPLFVLSQTCVLLGLRERGPNSGAE